MNESHRSDLEDEVTTLTDQTPGNALVFDAEGGYLHARCVREMWSAAWLAEAEVSSIQDGAAHGFACHGCGELLGDED